MPSWREQAACRGADTDLWVSPLGGNYAEARAVCKTCPVQPDCLAWAVEVRIPCGMWGGLGPAERARIRRKAAR